MSDVSDTSDLSSPVQTGIEPWLREILRCPACGGELVDAQGPTHIELQCTAESCGRAYRIDGGVPVLLVDEARETRETRSAGPSS